MSEMPRGTVAFLFTDVENSSALWERDGAAMMSAMARHVSCCGKQSALTAESSSRPSGMERSRPFPRLRPLSAPP